MVIRNVVLCSLLLLAGCSAPVADSADAPLPPGWGLVTAGYPDGDWFVENGAQRGFTHRIESPSMSQTTMAAMTGGVAVADHDGDGDEDVYIATDGPNLLYENQGDATFVEVAAERGVRDLGNGRAPLWFDADNDGDPDLFVGNMQGPNSFYRNDGGMYERIDGAAGLLGNGTTQAAAVADVDLDGDLDLFCGNYGAWWEGNLGYGPSGDQDRDLLYINDGTGSFHEAGQAWGLEGKWWTLGASFGDADNDGDPDLMIANDFGDPDPLYENLGDRFVRIDERVGIRSMRDGMGVVWFDADNDGDLESYISNIYEQSLHEGDRFGNYLWTRGDDGMYRDHAAFSGTLDALWSWGADAFDADSDGDLDLYVPNGFPDARPIEVDPFAEPTMGTTQPNRFFENRGGGRFVEAAEAWGLALPEDGRGVASFDADQDGDLDLVHVVHGGPVQFLENRAPQGTSIRILLEGEEANRDAVGTWVTVSAGGVDQVRYTVAGHGYLSQDSRWVHVGLGLHGAGDVTVRWPGGAVQQFEDVAAGAYALREGGDIQAWS